MVKNKVLANVNEWINPYGKLTYAEYFAGIGLVRLGLEQAGWKVVFSNDWSYSKFEMYSAHFKDASEHYKVQDIFSICPADIPNTLLATASFPCIDLSLAGNLGGISGQHSSAFWGFTQILDRQVNKPKLVMLENVVGWLTSNHGQDFRITIQELNRLGYACDVFAIDASHFVPQSRLRIFVVGVQAPNLNQDIFIFSKRSSSLKTKALEKVVVANLDLHWHFWEIPSLPDKIEFDLSLVVENIPDNDDRWWHEDEVKRHLNMMSSVNLAYVKGLQDVLLYSYCPMYRRVREGRQRAELRKDGLAGCLRTAKGGSSRQMLVRAGQGTIKMRLMTPREYARLQGVPDDYPIPSQVNQALTGFGDAVCVPVIVWIAENILNPLAKSLQENTLVLHH
ncbi:MAG TPA: DNA (cytosine-5-)-methyltransferase [Cyanobacteria bacterium UBA8803]|nr:DNA (cytosine-5-)-methyltransferase [Cyanobacteria bacterium UBA9273]HBL61568.1 DNA (cytosine-5-)-methyltransferase [Cyanobacteria bacterium UBA8803]